MDFSSLSLAELKAGYRFAEQENMYICIHCDLRFQIGQIFSIDDHFYDAEHAVAKHIEAEHSGNFELLLHSTTKYNTLTDVQKRLLSLFYSGKSDRDIAKELSLSDSTVRHQKFTFREKAKQAKLYLALYEQAFEKKNADENEIVPIHNSATMVDERYVTTEKERTRILNTAFESLSPLKLKEFSPKAKKQIIILARIAEEFEAGKKYSEQEVTELLKNIYCDHVALRRSLVDYGFLDRTSKGDAYWLK